MIEHYASAIAALPKRDRLGKTDLLIPEFLLFKDQNVQIYYAPFDFVNTQAKVCIVGITPGWTQMEIALRRANAVLLSGGTAADASKAAKEEASFAGTMRKNLVTMLDNIGLQTVLGIQSCGSLFLEPSELLHSTSAIRYPTFVNGSDYKGHSPDLLSHSELSQYVERVLAPELSSLHDALIVPLGKSVDGVIRKLIGVGALSPERCLLGSPHPSGANGHRQKELERMRGGLMRTIVAWTKAAT